MSSKHLLDVSCRLHRGRRRRRCSSDRSATIQSRPLGTFVATLATARACFYCMGWCRFMRMLSQYSCEQCTERCGRCERCCASRWGFASSARKSIFLTHAQRQPEIFFLFYFIIFIAVKRGDSLLPDSSPPRALGTTYASQFASA